MSRFNTLLLDQTEWDLVLDSSGNIAKAEPPYALAQDVASAVRLFLGELWYDTTKGIPYFEDVLGHLPPLPLLTGHMQKAALSVPGVVSARVLIDSFNSREITGQIQFIDETGAANNVRF
jgi:hypothetical protein